MKLPVYNLRRPEAGPKEQHQFFLDETYVDERVEVDSTGFRERILNSILVLTSIIGVILYLTNLPGLINLALNPAGGIAGWTWLALFSLFIIILLVTAFVKGIPYSIRAVIFLLVLFGVSLIALFANGLTGNGRLLLFLLPIFASIFFGVTGRISSLLLSIGAMVLISMLMSNQGLLNIGIIPASLPISYLTSNYPWGVSAGIFTLLAIVATASVGAFFRELEDGLRKRQTAIDDLERQQAYLENQAQKFTYDLDRRLIQIRTAAEITRSISRGSITMPLEVLLTQVCQLILDRFGLYYVGVFLVEKGEKYTPLTDKSSLSLSPREFAVLTAGTGEAGRKLIAERHKLEVGGSSMIGWATANQQYRIALDVGQESVRFDNPHLPETRSELAVPILSQKVALGALTIQSREVSAFDQDDVVVMQGIADNLASAIENARLYKETQVSLNEIQTLHRQYLERAWTETLQARGDLEYTFSPTTTSTAYAESPSGESEVSTTSDLGQEEQETMSSQRPQRTLSLPIKLRDQMIGNLFLEAERLPEGTLPDQDKLGEDSSLLTAEWTPGEIALIEGVINQAALALENARLLDEAQRRATREQLTSEVTTSMRTSLDMNRIMQTAIQEISDRLGIAQVEIRLGTPRE